MTRSIARGTVLMLALTWGAGAEPPAKRGLYGLPRLDRADFNRLAVQAALPLFWMSDDGNPGEPDPGELAALDGSGGTWARAGKLTPAFEKAYRGLAERRRREALAAELDQGRITPIATDFSKLTAEDRAVMKHLAVAAQAIDDLYQEQVGAGGLKARIPFEDTLSRSVFARNQGPACSAPMTADDPFCNALSDFFEPRSHLYPLDVTVDEAFCKSLSKLPDAKALLDPFTVVRRDRGGELVAVPYTRAYAKGMRRVAVALRAAAEAIHSAEEQPMKAYLLAAAGGFETNEWWEADEAWSRMSGSKSSGSSSRWYIRVAPDETYFEPCQMKAGFHMSLARLDRSALAWQERLTAVRKDMEQAVAEAIGEPYQARDVRFHLPEFVEIVLNAGDSRSPLGGTIGQSLPNFGPVAEQSRGRTVAMSNLYADPTSRAVARRRAESLLTPESMKYWTEDPAAGRLDTVLHEATHNFGPAGSYKVEGKLPEEIFGGRTDAILEEAKAQAGSLFFLPWLAERKMLTEAEVANGYASTVTWAFGHIARGMWTPDGQPKTYSQISAILVGTLLRAGALVFVEGGDGPDPGRFEIVPEKFPPVVRALMGKVGGIKARGDVAAARQLIDEAVSAEALRTIRAGIITERVLRYPKESFVYSVKYE